VIDAKASAAESGGIGQRAEASDLWLNAIHMHQRSPCRWAHKDPCDSHTAGALFQSWLSWQNAHVRNGATLAGTSAGPHTRPSTWHGSSTKRVGRRHVANGPTVCVMQECRVAWVGNVVSVGRRVAATHGWRGVAAVIAVATVVAGVHTVWQVAALVVLALLTATSSLARQNELVDSSIQKN
jgi:hypothetical protein